MFAEARTKMNLTQVQTYNARNAKILSLLIEGLPAKQIAQQVETTELAIHCALCRIRQKEGVQTNTALVAKLLTRRFENQEKSRRAA